jgi:hypothetical protein
MAVVFPARDLTGAHDQAAVIDSRIQNINGVTIGGPLPWLPGIPERIAADPKWGPYLDARSQLVAQLADQVRLNAAGEAPAWAAKPHASMPAGLIADIQVWRAATQVDSSDLRPTGPPQLGYATRIWQQQLDIRLAAAETHTGWQWRHMLATEVPDATADPFLPELEERLSNLTRAGFDAGQLVRSAAAAGPLPDDHPAAAPLVAHPRSAPARAEPGRRNPRRSPSDEAHDYAVTRPAATHAALGGRLLPSARAAERKYRPTMADGSGSPRALRRSVVSAQGQRRQTGATEWGRPLASGVRCSGASLSRQAG